MMLSSRKYLKQHSRKDKTASLTKLKLFTLGYYSAFALTSGKCCSNQIDAIKLLLRRSLKKQLKLWVRIIAHGSLTKKPNETRLGRGKGNVKYWYSKIKPGKSIVELKGNSIKAMQTLEKLHSKTNIKVFNKAKANRWII